MNQSSAPKPTKLRQAIDRAIARVQAEAAAEEVHAEQRAIPAPPKPLSGAEVLHASLEVPAPTEPLVQPLSDSTVIPEAVQDSEELAGAKQDLSADLEQAEATETVTEQGVEVMLQAPESTIFQRDLRYQEAAERAMQRDRSLFPVIERALTPMSAAELGWQRPQLRRPIRQSEPELLQFDEPEEGLSAEIESSEVLAPSEVATETPLTPDRVEPSEPRVETPRKPLTPEVLAAISPDVAPLPELRRPPTYFAILAGLLWATVLGWLLFGGLGPHSSSTAHWLFGATTLILGICTWGPIQWGLRLPSLTWRGTLGWMIVFWWLAFVRPPTSSLTSLPDTPLYILFCIGVFMALSALIMPILYFRRVQRSGSRRERFDIRRTQRQANEVALFVALCIVLAAMNVLELVSVILLIMILALSEMLLLSIQRT